VIAKDTDEYQYVLTGPLVQDQSCGQVSCFSIVPNLMVDVTGARHVFGWLKGQYLGITKCALFSKPTDGSGRYPSWLDTRNMLESRNAPSFESLRTVVEDILLGLIPGISKTRILEIQNASLF
jgi:hypothetical protein